MVAVHYVARLAGDGDDGPVVDTTDVDVALTEDAYFGSRDYEPLEFVVGSGDVLPVVDDAIREMESGETRTVVVEPEDGFGPRSEANVVEFPRSVLEERNAAEAEVDELVVTETGEAGWISSVSEDTVEVDFNHELAEERVAFEIRLLDVEPAAGVDRPVDAEE